MFRTLLLILYVTAMPLISFAQKEAYNWYFGQNAAISFETSPPQFVPGSNMSAFEGCASISDGDGNLLFYTNGINVWDKTHSIMPNGTGLFGNMSSSQSAVIVKAVNETNVYYIFTASPYDDPGVDNGLNYSVVDMTANSGNGDVVTKNVQLEANTTEKITIVAHSNGTDYWVITSKSKKNEYLAFKVTESGISATPVSSPVGSLGFSIDPTNSLGYMKPSPDGKYIAACFWGKGVELLEFNNTTGELTNPIDIVTGDKYYYGMEFSPNGKYVYITYNDPAAPPIVGRVWQYDISSGDETTIQSSAYQVFETQNQVGTVQLGPDNKIYCAAISQNYLSVINEPNMPQAACDFVEVAVSLSSQKSYMGLPPFYVFNFQSSATISYTDSCYADSTMFNVQNLGQADSIKWNFDDIPSGVANTSTDTAAEHVFTSAGNYSVKLIRYNNGTSDTITKEVIIYPKPNIGLGLDTALCENTSLQLNADVGNYNYLWHDGDTNRERLITTSGSYSLTVSDSICSSRDTINVSFEQVPGFILPDTTICDNNSFIVSIDNKWENVRWNDGSKLRQRAFNDSGKYTVVVDYLNCSASDSFKINVIDCDTTGISSAGFIPNAFTPNADGLNDVFKPYEGLMLVFTRWGEQVYEGEDGWDGTYKSTMIPNVVPNGLYIYVVLDAQGNLIHKGTVYLLR